MARTVHLFIAAAIAAGPMGHIGACLRHADTDLGDEVTTVATATMISPTTTRESHDGSGDFVQDIMEAASRIDQRLRMSLTAQEYAMVQDLVLATRISSIALDAADEREASTAA
jgi:hypothetical protein